MAAAKSYSDEKRWIVVYPAFLDKKKTANQGRKIPTSLAVENPTVLEIHDVLVASGLNPVLERGKMYPRDQDREPDSQGRVRVQLKQDDGSPKFPQYPTRASILKLCAELIPKLKTRQPGYVPPAAPGTSGTKKPKKKK